MIIPENAGLPYASWGIGISATSEQQAEAWKTGPVYESKDVTRSCHQCPCIPWQRKFHLILCEQMSLFGPPFEVFQTGYLANEFVGLPVARRSDALVRRAVPDL